MRWEDERYVRLYTRDTLTWIGLGWEGQAVLALLFRKVDRAGVLEIDDYEPVEALAGVTGIPVEICAVAWKRLSTGKRPTVTFRDDPSRALVIPNFLEAQESRQSDAARARKSREMARAVRTVTNRDDKSQNVTERHTQSHGVTPSRAVPSHAVPSQDQLQLAPSGAAHPPAPAPAAPATPFAQYVAAEWPDVKDPNAYEMRAQAAFPGVDLLVEARKARGWELSSPQNRKSKHGPFLWRWLSRAQDGASARSPQQQRGPAPGAAVLRIDPNAHSVPGRKMV